MEYTGGCASRLSELPDGHSSLIRSPNTRQTPPVRAQFPHMQRLPELSQINRLNPLCQHAWYSNKTGNTGARMTRPGSQVGI